MNVTGKAKETPKCMGLVKFIYSTNTQVSASVTERQTACLRFQSPPQLIDVITGSYNSDLRQLLIPPPPAVLPPSAVRLSSPIPLAFPTVEGARPLCPSAVPARGVRPRCPPAVAARCGRPRFPQAAPFRVARPQCVPSEPARGASLGSCSGQNLRDCV